MYYHDMKLHRDREQQQHRQPHRYGDIDGSAVSPSTATAIPSTRTAAATETASADGTNTDLWADAPTAANVGNNIYRYSTPGTLIGVQVFNGSWYGKRLGHLIQTEKKQIA